MLSYRNDAKYMAGVDVNDEHDQRGRKPFSLSDTPIQVYYLTEYSFGLTFIITSN